MQKKITDTLVTHNYPKIYFTFPFLLFLQHKITHITTLRNWYVKREVSKNLKKLKTPFRFLDAGCGAGDFIFSFAKKNLGSLFTGIDKNSGNISICSRFSSETKTANVLFFKNDLQQFNCTEKSDIIICITVLQYVENDLLVLKNFYSWLNDSGRLIIYVPVNYNNYFSFYPLLKKKFFSKTDYDLNQSIKRHYSDTEILEKISRAQFTIESLVYTYGQFGKISFEVHSLFLLSLQKLPLFLLPFFVVIYLVTFFPLTVAFNIIDFLTVKKTGNGLLAVCKKQ